MAANKGMTDACVEVVNMQANDNSYSDDTFGYVFSEDGEIE